MKTFILIWLTALLGVAVNTEAQTVSNVRAAQRAGTKLVDVYYDLSGATAPSTVAVAVSDNGGASYTLPASSLSGDVGGGVNAGPNKHVIWNAGADWNGQFSQAVRFRVTATGPPPAPDGFALIPAGTFTMGRTSGDTDEDAPPVSVYVSAFFMAKYEVSKALWDEVRTWGQTRGYGDLQTGGGKAANHPAHTITWYGAVKWCNARSEREGLTPCYTVSGATYRTGNNSAVVCNWTASGYRLPTEAEWEKAARGGLSGLRFPWGDTITHSQANYSSSNSYSYDVSPTRGIHPSYNDGGWPYTAPAGSFAANGYGLHDMVGNVPEWCWDWFSSAYANGASDPRGAVSGSLRVKRGGGSDWAAIGSRTAFRSKSPVTSAFTPYAMGFRPARSSVP